MNASRSFLATLAILLTAPAVHAQAPTHLWSQRFGDAVGGQETRSVAVDASGNVIITGRFLSTVDFGGGSLVSAGPWDIFVAKFDPNGTHLWSKSFGDGSDEQGESLAVDSSGNVIVTGRFWGNVDFGGGTLTSAGGYDIFVVKFDPSGNHLWSKRFGDSLYQEGWGIAVDASANVIVSGLFKGTVDFGGGPLTSAGDWDVCVAKLDTNGNHLWSKRFGDAGSQVAYSVDIDSTDNIIVTGHFTSTIDFGGGPLTSSGLYDTFLVKFDPNGTHVWSQRFGDVDDQRGWGVAIDASDNILATGIFTGVLDFGGGPLTSTSGWDVFLAKLGPGGGHLWSKSFGDTGDQVAYRVAVDPSGHVVLTGHFWDTIDFGGGTLTSAGDWDVFLAEFDPSGAHEWSQRFGDANWQIAGGVATDALGNVLVTGYFWDTIDFGGGALTSAGASDIFLAKLGSPGPPPLPPEPLILSTLDVDNDQGRWVRVSFRRSGHDTAGAATPILQYEAYRRIDPLPPSSAARAEGDHPELGARIRAAREAGMLSGAAALLADWDYVGAIPAHGDSVYNMIAPTLADSTISSGQHWSVFFIRAATAVPVVFFDSPPDSGYSLDNLVPSVPTGLELAITILTWDQCPDADFDYFTVYGSDTGSIQDVTMIGYTVNPTLDVQFSPFAWYHVTASDFAGNEGGDTAIENIVTGVEPAVLSFGYALGIPRPNPFSDQTSVVFEIPRTAHTALHIYDVAGRLVRTLVNRRVERGVYTPIWDGRDASGRATFPGVYFMRLESADFLATRRVVRVR